MMDPDTLPLIAAANAAGIIRLLSDLGGGSWTEKKGQEHCQRLFRMKRILNAGRRKVLLTRYRILFSLVRKTEYSKARSTRTVN
jgi:hypothetical protein